MEEDLLEQALLDGLAQQENPDADKEVQNQRILPELEIANKTQNVTGVNEDGSICYLRLNSSSFSDYYLCKNSTEDDRGWSGWATNFNNTNTYARFRRAGKLSVLTPNLSLMAFLI